MYLMGYRPAASLINRLTCPEFCFRFPVDFRPVVVSFTAVSNDWILSNYAFLIEFWCSDFTETLKRTNLEHPYLSPRISVKIKVIPYW